MSTRTDSEMINLDIRCAELGQRLSSQAKSEKIFREALSVLDEQGLYAMLLYLRARHEDTGHEFSKLCANFLNEIILKKKDETKEPLEVAKNIAKDLHSLFLARELLHRALAYAWYYFKAKKDQR